VRLAVLHRALTYMVLVRRHHLAQIGLRLSVIAGVLFLVEGHPLRPGRWQLRQARVGKLVVQRLHELLAAVRHVGEQTVQTHGERVTELEVWDMENWTGLLRRVDQRRRHPLIHPIRLTRGERCLGDLVRHRHRVGIEKRWRGVFELERRRWVFGRALRLYKRVKKTLED